MKGLEQVRAGYFIVRVASRSTQALTFNPNTFHQLFEQAEDGLYRVKWKRELLLLVIGQPFEVLVPDPDNDGSDLEYGEPGDMLAQVPETGGLEVLKLEEFEAKYDWVPNIGIVAPAASTDSDEHLETEHLDTEDLEANHPDDADSDTDGDGDGDQPARQPSGRLYSSDIR